MRNLLGKRRLADWDGVTVSANGSWWERVSRAIGWAGVDGGPGVVVRERVQWATGGSHTLGGLRGAPFGVGTLNRMSGMIGSFATLGARAGTLGGGTGGFGVSALMLDLVTREGGAVTGAVGGWVGLGDSVCVVWGTDAG